MLQQFYAFFLHGMSKSLGLMVLLACLKFCWRILNFAGTVFEAKVAPAKDPRQQNSADARQKIPSLISPHPLRPCPCEEIRPHLLYLLTTCILAESKECTKYLLQARHENSACWAGHTLGTPCSSVSCSHAGDAHQNQFTRPATAFTSFRPVNTITMIK